MQYTLGRRLRVLRVERGLTLRDAERVTGVDKDTLSKIERGVRHPYDVTLAKVAQGYGVPVEELLEEPVPLGEAPRGVPRGEVSDEERRTIYDAIESLGKRKLDDYNRELADPDSPHFRDVTSAALWIDGVQKDVTQWANWVIEEAPTLAALGGERTLGESIKDAFKVSGHLMGFHHLIRSGRSKLKELEEMTGQQPDKRAQIKLVESTPLVDEALAA
jgi:transcriptional regulator with XRE-family HTH domain